MLTHKKFVYQLELMSILINNIWFRILWSFSRGLSLCGYKYVSLPRLGWYYQKWPKSRDEFPIYKYNGCTLSTSERRNAWTDSSLLCFLDIIFLFFFLHKFCRPCDFINHKLFYYFRIIRLQVIVIPKGFHTALPHTENISSKKPISIFY